MINRISVSQIYGIIVCTNVMKKDWKEAWHYGIIEVKLFYELK